MSITLQTSLERMQPKDPDPKAEYNTGFHSVARPPGSSPSSAASELALASESPCLRWNNSFPVEDVIKK